VQVQRLLDTVAAGTAAFRHLYNSVGERLMTELGLSQRHACELMSLQRSRARYVSHPRSIEAATVARIREYSHEQPMYGQLSETPGLADVCGQILLIPIYGRFREMPKNGDNPTR
jgi:hypothetical protein